MSQPLIEKKLLTLAAVLGILACGACFLPPERQPLPPLPPQLSRVHTIAVRVEDSSTSDALDSERMSAETSVQFKCFLSEHSVHAKQWHHDTPADATLRIVLINKSLFKESESLYGQTWVFQLTFDAQLTSSDGKLLWKQEHEPLRFNRWYPHDSPALTWKNNDVFLTTAYNLAQHISSIIVSPQIQIQQENP